MPNKFLKFFKTNALFICMIVGVVFHDVIVRVSFTTPYLLFSMLLITYCRVSLLSIRLKPLHLWMLCVQFVGCLLVYFILKFFSPDLAGGSMLCVLAPTATASAVIAGLLGGNIASMATYAILSNLSVAFLAPVIFSVLGAHGSGEDLGFIQSFLTICAKVMPLLLGPLILALILKKLTPRIHRQLRDKQEYSFWIWTVALTIVMANTASNLTETIREDRTIIMHVILIVLSAAVICWLQFSTGWFLGKKYKDRITGGQGLGQKNTILAIWMANTFFNPLVAIAPASYVVWQNIVNSYQLWKHQRKQDKEG